MADMVADTVADMVGGVAVVEGLEARLLIATVTRLVFVQGSMSLYAFPRCRKRAYRHIPC